MTTLYEAVDRALHEMAATMQLAPKIEGLDMSVPFNGLLKVLPVIRSNPGQAVDRAKVACEEIADCAKIVRFDNHPDVAGSLEHIGRELSSVIAANWHCDDSGLTGSGDR